MDVIHRYLVVTKREDTLLRVKIDMRAFLATLTAFDTKQITLFSSRHLSFAMLRGFSERPLDSLTGASLLWFFFNHVARFRGKEAQGCFSTGDQVNYFIRAMQKIEEAFSKSTSLEMRFNVMQRKRNWICMLWRSVEVMSVSVSVAGAFRSLSKSFSCGGFSIFVEEC